MSLEDHHALIEQARTAVGRWQQKVTRPDAALEDEWQLERAREIPTIVDSDLFDRFFSVFGSDGFAERCGASFKKQDTVRTR